MIEIRHKDTGAVILRLNHARDKGALTEAVTGEKCPTAANLGDMKLRGVRLEDGNLVGATMRRADLSLARCRRADLQRADLQPASLLGADLKGAHLAGANLANANLTGACLVGIRVRDAGPPFIDRLHSLAQRGRADRGSPPVPPGLDGPDPRHRQ